MNKLPYLSNNSITHELPKLHHQNFPPITDTRLSHEPIYLITKDNTTLITDKLSVLSILKNNRKSSDLILSIIFNQLFDRFFEIDFQPVFQDKFLVHFSRSTFSPFFETDFKSIFRNRFLVGFFENDFWPIFQESFQSIFQH